MANEHLATYLNDHLAGSVGALELLERLESESAESKAFFAELRADIESDRQELQALMRRLGIAESRTRKVGGWLADKLAQLKLRLDDKAAGSLCLLETLELIGLGIDGKKALWRDLNAAAETAPELRGNDYECLVQRAKEQRGRVETVRLQAAKAAFAAMRS